LVNKSIDYVLYGDTDSLFYSIETFIENKVGLDKWNALTLEDKIIYCKRITNIVSEHVNSKSYNTIQKKDFNSQRKDFRIVFEQEIIASTGLWVDKKRYGLGIVDKAGVRKDELFIKGLEIIQSLTPIAIKHRLKNMLQLILSGAADKDISRAMKIDKKELMTAHPNDIAVNVAAKNLDKYIVNGKPIKGTPWTLKGINHFNNIIKTLDLTTKYEKIGSVGDKVRVVYIKEPNAYNIDIIGFIRWPDELKEAGVEIDYQKMVEKYYTNKLQHLLAPVNKGNLVYGGDIGSFFN
jgi:DNA polymerase elongation subunit (family B)